jgi:hypothetical protein
MCAINSSLGMQVDVLLLQLVQQHVQLQLHDLAHIRLAQGTEHDQLVHAVEELGAYGLGVYAPNR